MQIRVTLFIFADKDDKSLENLSSRIKEVMELVTLCEYLPENACEAPANIQPPRTVEGQPFVLRRWRFGSVSYEVTEEIYDHLIEIELSVEPALVFEIWDEDESILFIPNLID